jgi:hypothetical protein
LRSYIKEGIVDQVRAAGGEVYAITSEPQRLADQARESWELNFETIGDPHHEISETCRERGWLKLVINTQTELFERHKGEAYAHPKGYFQPGVIALDASANILYRWRGIPHRGNMGGATERPEVNYVWEQIKQARQQSPADAELDTKPELDSRGLPWPLFLSLLIANGWFIKPRVFSYIPGGPSAPARVKRAFRRLLVFIGACTAAFVFLPTPWVGAALLAWGLWLTPHIRFFSRQFQHVKDSDLD